MIKFKSFLKLNENFGLDHDFSGLKPHHVYYTKDGHKIHVHVMNGADGKHAIFFNHNIGAVTKLVHWSKDAKQPSKEDLEKAGHDHEDHEDEHLHESYLTEVLKPNSAGKIAEHSAVIHMFHHMHRQNGTLGTPQHIKDIKPHKEAIKHYGQGAEKDEVHLRVKHGEAMANSALETLKLKHGPHMKISGVHHTAKPGDIERATKGKHKDSQDNPSDMVVHVTVPKSKSLKESTEEHEHHFEGFSLKSSAKQKDITAKSPAIGFHGTLDHKTRKLGTQKISHEGLEAIHDSMGHTGKTDKQRKDIVKAHREKEGVSHGSKIELHANELNRHVHEDLAKELHKHLNHLTSKTGEEGHHQIGKLLQNHLTHKSGMSWHKIHVKGHQPNYVHATVTPGSEHPLNKVFSNKKTRYGATRSGNTVTIHKQEHDGSHTPLAHYRPKAGDTAFASSSHKWDVKPAATH